MEMHQSAGIKGSLWVAICLPLIQSCTGIGGISGDMPLKVVSEPEGATVYIMGEAVGETPIAITQQRIYPAGYDADKQQQYGQLLIRKTGCRDLRKRIRYTDFDTGISVRLDCNATPGVTARQSIATPGTQQDHATSTRSMDVAPSSDTRSQPVAAPRQAGEAGAIEADAHSEGITPKQRLIRIDNLKRDGLISDEEYREIRKRILDAL